MEVFTAIGIVTVGILAVIGLVVVVAAVIDVVDTY